VVMLVIVSDGDSDVIYMTLLNNATLFNILLVIYFNLPMVPLEIDSQFGCSQLPAPSFPQPAKLMSTLFNSSHFLLTCP
jgi:hypothetical protein